MESPQGSASIARDEIRTALAAHLGLDPSAIGDHDDLIQLGLDSIRTMKLAGSWRKRGLPVNFAQLAAEPTLAAWHALLGGSAPGHAAESDAAGERPADQPNSGGTAADREPTVADVAASADSAVDPADGAPHGGGADLARNGTAVEVNHGAALGDPSGFAAAVAPAADVPSAGMADDGSPFGLAPMQHAYWVGRSEGQELGAVAAHLYVEFDGGGVDSERLGVAVEGLVRRHPMLRTRFLADGTQQTLERPGREVWSVTDLRDVDAESVERALEELRDSRTHQLMAVEDGQVIDVSLTLLPEGRTRLHLDVDMLAADAMSYRVLVADLARLYHGEELPPQTYTFRQYLAEHGGPAPEHDVHRDWWQHRLADLPGAPELPRAATATAVSEPASEAAGGARRARTVRLHRWLSPEAKGRMFAAAHARGITPAMALASVFAETIGGWSAQRRFLLNLPLFHREPVHPQVDGVVGDFTSSVLLEVDVTEPATVTERARTLQRELHAAGAHSAYTGLEVLRDLGRLRGEPVLAPIVYTSAINLGELFADQVTATFGDPVWIISQGPQVLLDAQVTEVRGGLLLNWDVRADAFPADLVETMFTRYIDAVLRLAGSDDAASDGTAAPAVEPFSKGAAGEPPRGSAGWDAEAAVRIPIEQAVVRARVNATDGPVSGRVLHSGLFEFAATNPDAPAVIWESEPVGTRVLSYGELAAEALAVAGALRAAGVRPGDAVAVQLPKGPDQIVATAGVLAAGGVYVPIGFDQPAARRAEILRTGEVVAAVTAGAEVPEVRTLALSAARVYPEPLAEAVIPDPADIAYVLFTSGSTGKPKGVEVPHRAAMNTIDDLNERFGVGAGDRVLALSALEFDLSVYDIFGLLSAGGAVVALDEGQRGEPRRWVELIRRHGISVLNCVPSLLDMLLEAAAGSPVDSLRMVILGGDWVDVALPGRLAAVAPKCRFAGLGGATETAIHSTICEVVNAEVPQAWSAVPYGTPLRNVRCRVVGPSGQDCPDWVSGELWIGGAGVAAGYRGDPERTADRFVTHEGLRWYRTGDLARYLPDGYLEFLGRADHQVKIRGYRVELGEVESALRALPGVRHAIAAVIGSAAPKLAAVVVGEEGVVLEVPDLLAAAAELLPAYMIPSRVELLAELPFTSNGKPDRKAILALLAEGESEGETIAPRTDVERAVADIVATVLGRESISVTDDFFALGGDSVLATAVVARVREWLDSPDTVVADFFAARTVEGLSRRLLERERQAGATGRLDEVARLYLEVTAMTDEEILALS
ncbi:non-ribosomal peptide synthetase [Nocardia sp. CDC160]|uniref:non-ribosomal peptide synthetase n=1 Tax=Nocardia sp. CDC160 TaxID=3112166 RepID=UPI002DB6AB14|nr:amino acid adenylation domain-containing protein [Nocardia sp. CDC160]MEC3913539.1 amino acid adenylation domain-containing protein [Nocardia sp. CDC160]